MRNQNSSSSLDAMAMQSSSNLDNMFQPITNSTYDTTMNVDSDVDINKKMEMMNNLRQMEQSRGNERPPTPDFLKSQRTQKSNNTEKRQEPSQSMPSNFPDNGNLNFQPSMNNNDTMAFNSNSNNFNNTNELSSYNDGGASGFTSIDEMNKPLIQGEIVEDKSSFEDRLNVYNLKGIAFKQLIQMIINHNNLIISNNNLIINKK